MLIRGVIGLENGYITNIRTGHMEPPDGEPWQAYLFCWNIREYKTRTTRTRVLKTLEAPSRYRLKKRIQAFIDRDDVVFPVDGQGKEYEEAAVQSPVEFACVKCGAEVGQPCKSLVAYRKSNKTYHVGRGALLDAEPA